ncbi:MAG TPA: S8 family serine peptidase [Thermoanaerobaculia bacterium]|nr:S8 family serine peptidase [Thermoanaerobaculia bacterium]
MKRGIAVLLGFFLTFPLLAAETQRYLVSTRGGTKATARTRVASNAALAAERQVRTFRNVNAFAANLTAEEVAELRQSGDVIVEPVIERSLDSADLAGFPARVRTNEEVTPQADPQEIPWGLQMIHAKDVWNVTRGENVNVVVMDTGIDYSHPDLQDAYVGGYNVFDPSKTPMDGHRHGTHVAGTIAAADNDFGVIGVAPKVKLWGVKVLADDGRGTNETVAAGFDWVMSKQKELGGRWVINLSLGSTIASEIEERAVSDTLSQDIVIVASAGNRSIDALKYPAKYPGVIAVGAIDINSEKAYFSSYGVGLTIMAPGVDVRSTIIKGIQESTDIRTSNELLEAWRVTGSPYASVTARVLDCGIGLPTDFPWDIRGKIALIRRSSGMSFREKVRNAHEAGAAAVIIATFEEDRAPSGDWTLPPLTPDPFWESYPFPLTVGTYYETGEKLAKSSSPITVSHRTALYGEMDGTSMAAPHVTGTVALMLSAAPDLAVAQIDYVLRHSAHDIDVSGWDYNTAWGIVDAFAAAKWVAPQKFGVSPPPPVVSPKRRAVR